MTSSQPTPKLISLKKENFKPDMIKSKKSFDGPYSRCFDMFTHSRCFTMFIYSCKTFNMFTYSKKCFDMATFRCRCFSMATTVPSTTWTSSAPSSRTRRCSPSSSRTYCWPWDVFQQWWDVFQLKKSHAYTFTAGGMTFSDMQRKEGDALSKVAAMFATTAASS